MGRAAEPEREIVRRALPLCAPALLAALFLGAAVVDWRVGWSAAIGIAVVAVNLFLSGWSLAWAARVSLTALFATAMAGFVLRMAAVVALLFGLDRFVWFSPLAFGLAAVPATLLLLAYEMRLLAGGIGGALVIRPEQVGEEERVG